MKCELKKSERSLAVYEYQIKPSRHRACFRRSTVKTPQRNLLWQVFFEKTDFFYPTGSRCKSVDEMSRMKIFGPGRYLKDKRT
jgi:hypothetical protein